MTDAFINTGHYQREHGRRPSGRGSWAFCAADDYHKDNYLDFVFWANGMYRDARAAALAHFKDKTDHIVVCT